MIVYDFAVVGSGATGAMAAQTLVESGANVLMLDGGQRDEKYAKLIPSKGFVEIRRTETAQHRYFLGDEFESAGFGSTATGAQLTPPRRFIVANVERFLPLQSKTFAPMESLALGGLGSGWGLGCNVFSDAELQLASLSAPAMRDAYRTVAARVGISAADDDARPYTSAFLEGTLPAVPLDPTAEAIYARYTRRRRPLRAQGFSLGRPALALLSQPRGDRSATSLRDMDFYSDAQRAAWRPWMAVEALLKAPNFLYAGNLLITRFEEADGIVDVFALNLETLEECRFRCRRLVLAAGSLGTARIVLRSLPRGDVRLPLLCNPYTYVPSIVPQRVGRSMPDENSGFAQLQMFYDPDGAHSDVALASIYSYRSLMLFRLLGEAPANVRDARSLMSYLTSGLLIAGIHHPQGYSAGKTIWREPSASSPTGDVLRADFTMTQDERTKCDSRERAYMRALRSIGAWAVRRVRPPHGSSIHYAGTLPFSEREKAYALSPEGRLHGSRNVFVADGSGFTFLPAKGLTLSLMAQAHLVATRLVDGNA
jgi:GMC oxidoreductase